MIGFHIQQPVTNWTNGIRELPRRAVCVAVNDYFVLRDIKAVNSSVFTVFRKWWDDHPQWGGDYQEEKRRGRLPSRSRQQPHRNRAR